MSCDYIWKNGRCGNQELSSVLKGLHIQGTMLAIYTDRVDCSAFLNVPDPEHLLELRIFTPTTEFKALRATMDREFVWRFIDDDAYRAAVGEIAFRDGILTEQQYLDIDQTKSDLAAGHYRTTGGGAYTLPVTDAERIELCNYISYDAEGLAKVVDFRIVRILKRGEN